MIFTAFFFPQYSRCFICIFSFEKWLRQRKQKNFLTWLLDVCEFNNRSMFMIRKWCLFSRSKGFTLGSFSNLEILSGETFWFQPHKLYGKFWIFFSNFSISFQRNRKFDFFKVKNFWLLSKQFCYSFRVLLNPIQSSCNTLFILKHCSPWFFMFAIASFDTRTFGRGTYELPGLDSFWASTNISSSLALRPLKFGSRPPSLQREQQRSIQQCDRNTRPIAVMHC